jgi:prolyl 4-hydroxylase
MRRYSLSSTSLAPNFIGSWLIEPRSLCDDLITYFEAHPEKQKKGVAGQGVSLDIKKSVDISISPHDVGLLGNEVFKSYFDALFACHKDYLTQWPFFAEVAQKLEIGPFNIQRYHAGEHFQHVHTERYSVDTLQRVLAWMTYLNDMDDGGSTFFTHYDLEIQPRKGLTLIWPAEWTHAHRGNVVASGSKYIITGWMDVPVDA